MSDIDDVIERLVTEPGFRTLLATDPTGALAGYRLDEDDLEVLAATLDEGAAAEHAVEQRTSKSAFLQAVMGFVTPSGGTGSDAGGDLAVPEPTSPATDAFLELDGVEGESTRPPEPPGELAAPAGVDEAGGQVSTWKFERAWPSKATSEKEGVDHLVAPEPSQEDKDHKGWGDVGGGHQVTHKPGHGLGADERFEYLGADQPAPSGATPFEDVVVDPPSAHSSDEDRVESISMAYGKVTSPSPGTPVEGAGGGDAAGKTDDLGRVKPVFSHSPKNETDATPTDPSMASTRDEPLLPEGESPASPGNLAVPEPGQEDKDHKGWSNVTSFSQVIHKPGGSGADEAFEDVGVDQPAPSADAPTDDEVIYVPVRRTAATGPEDLAEPDAATQAEGNEVAIENVVIENERFDPEAEGSEGSKSEGD